MKAGSSRASATRPDLIAPGDGRFSRCADRLAIPNKIAVAAEKTGAAIYDALSREPSATIILDDVTGADGEAGRPRRAHRRRRAAQILSFR